MCIDWWTRLDRPFVKKHVKRLTIIPISDTILVLKLRKEIQYVS